MRPMERDDVAQGSRAHGEGCCTRGASLISGRNWLMSLRNSAI